MNNIKILPVILAGGSGQRLWPLSRAAYPKQFITIVDAEQSLFQSAVQRVAQHPNFLAPLIIGHEDYRFIIAEQLRQINIQASAIILEPSANNTAPAIALAAHWAQQHATDLQLLVLPADHYLANTQQFLQTVFDAQAVGQQQYLVTFGVAISKPETGYGYIKIGAALDIYGGYKVANFIEKPEIEVAKRMLHDQSYVWNSGMFMFNANTYLQELQNLQPEIVSATKAALNSAQQDSDFIRPAVNSYKNCPIISIDYAVMEHTKRAAVFKFPGTWSDIGSWQAVWQHSNKDSSGNVVVGDVVAQNSNNCLISAQHRLVATLDVHDLAIIETADAVLVAKREHQQDIKQLVNHLISNHHGAATEHRQVVRPWGWFDGIAKAQRFQVKHIFVDPGKSLSLQSHQHRSEHWVVVKGRATVVRDRETFVLNENESTYIPKGVKHQLANYNTIPLEIIEVQCGEYLGEDDIIRFNDLYGRITVNTTTLIE